MTKTLSWPQEPREMRDWRVQAEIKPAKRHKVFKFSLRLWGGGWEKECRRKGHVSHTVVGLMHVEPLGNKLCLLFTKLVCWSRSRPRRKHWPCFWMCVDRHENSSMGTIAAGWKHHVRISRLLLTGHSLFSICVYLWPSWFYIYCKTVLSKATLHLNNTEILWESNPLPWRYEHCTCTTCWATVFGVYCFCICVFAKLFFWVTLSASHPAVHSLVKASALSNMVNMLLSVHALSVQFFPSSVPLVLLFCVSFLPFPLLFCHMAENMRDAPMMHTCTLKLTDDR